MAEQHYLCAYTLRGLKSTADCHIERIRQPDGGGRLHQYCEAVAQVALKYAEREEKRAARMRQRVR